MRCRNPHTARGGNRKACASHITRLGGISKGPNSTGADRWRLQKGLSRMEDDPQQQKARAAWTLSVDQSLHAVRTWAWTTKKGP